MAKAPRPRETGCVLAIIALIAFPLLLGTVL